MRQRKILRSALARGRRMTEGNGLIAARPFRFDARHSGRLTRGALAKSAAGYSLAELMAVMAIVALALAVAPLGFSRALPGARLSADAERFAADLRALRGEAVETGRDVVVHIDGGKATPSAGARKLRSGDAAAVRYLAADAGGVLRQQDTFRFLPDGGSSGGVFVLSADGRERRVAVHWLFGHVQVVKAGSSSEASTKARGAQ